MNLPVDAHKYTKVRRATVHDAQMRKCGLTKIFPLQPMHLAVRLLMLTQLHTVEGLVANCAVTYLRVESSER